jgi:nitrogen fixation/metabolism regulation signal transduction histidine kinase
VDQKEQLVQAERVAAWRELARRLAHELKNPLFPLQITVENMQRARATCPDQFDEVFDESSRAILAELANLKNIISRFSDFARMPQPEIQTVDLNEIAREVLNLFQSQLDRPDHPVRCETHLDSSAGTIRADPEQIGRVLQNLVLNALDAMPEGGRLQVRTRDDGDGIVLEVSDSGVGLTQEERERIFTPYYTTKQHGTGLGLAIVQSIISDHGGRIYVESQAGKGTTFRIRLFKNPPVNGRDRGQ